MTLAYEDSDSKLVVVASVADVDAEGRVANLRAEVWSSS